MPYVSKLKISFGREKKRIRRDPTQLLIPIPVVSLLPPLLFSAISYHFPLVLCSLFTFAIFPRYGYIVNIFFMYVTTATQKLSKRKSEVVEEDLPKPQSGELDGKNFKIFFSLKVHFGRVFPIAVTFRGQLQQQIVKRKAQICILAFYAQRFSTRFQDHTKWFLLFSNRPQIAYYFMFTCMKH